MTKTQLKIKKKKKIYPNGIEALRSIDLEVNYGDFINLIGLSGSGKSTLLRCINRLIEPTSGKIYWYEKEVNFFDNEKIRNYRKQIGMIFQQFNLIKNLSVLYNVLLGYLGYMKTIPSLFIKFDRKLVEIALEKLEMVGLSRYKDEKVRNLSGGQQQRVGIARALMQNPKMILADEPVASLDPVTTSIIFNYLRKINEEQNITIITSLHHLEFIKEFSTRVVALNAGNKIFDGRSENINKHLFKEIYKSYED